MLSLWARTWCPGIKMPGIKNAEAWLEFKYRFTVEAWIYFLGDPWGLGLSLKQTLDHPKNYFKKILINYGTSESLSLNLWLLKKIKLETNYSNEKTQIFWVGQKCCLKRLHGAYLPFQDDSYFWGRKNGGFKKFGCRDSFMNNNVDESDDKGRKMCSCFPFL
jgi:hypothetical protein